jgi:HD superfamily phosphodiesterase
MQAGCVMAGKVRMLQPKPLDKEAELIEAMEAYFGSDQNRINHALQVLDYCKQIMKSEGGDRDVIIAAAVLHDIGIPVCEKKYGQAGGQLQEQEGPPVAREIMSDLLISESIIDEVCIIIASHHSAGEVESLNFSIIWDADWLVNLEGGKADLEEMKAKIAKIFQTAAGRGMAEEKFLQ